MPAEINGSISDVSDAELASVTNTIVSQPDVDADDRDRFFGQVQALVEGRAQAGWPAESADTIAIFVRADYPREAASALTGTKPSADMQETVEPLMGRVFLLDRNARQGWSANLPSADAGEIIEWLRTLPFGGSQVILAYRTGLMMIERANGAHGEMTRREPIRMQPAAVTQQGLFEALDAFHMNTVLTPRNCASGIWSTGHAENYHAGPTPELSIQGQLKTFLTAWFYRKLRVDPEISTEIGRIDLGLLIPPANPGGGLTYWGVIELKVVKSYRHSTSGQPPAVVTALSNAQDVAKGVQQAHAFRTNRGCSCAVLEVYDMRADKNEDPREHVEVQNVLLSCQPPPDIRLVPLFGSAHQARDAGFIPPP